ncbi:hypothetical protein BVG18_00425 [Acinetobacter lwoffii]|uniref:hypothetical protein n=1 Tax=Acinetobacter lwoffii TaxID=28090 RepID=UPI000A320A71|nr:hypothetical protein BVG18_00425 [Acinetobacter lwoffii]
MSEYENWFSVRFPNIQATIDQSNDQESKLLKLACKEVWQHQQAEIDDLRSQLNNMEACYIQMKKERDDAVYLKNEHRKRRCELAKEFTQKSLRLTDAEFEYKRIKELQAKDCLQIMRLTARNEKLSDELKALRGEHD